MLHVCRGAACRRWVVTLSCMTLGLLRSLTNDVEVILYYDREESLYPLVSALLSEYQLACPRIRVRTVDYIRDPAQAAEGADLVATDVWASMGQEEEQSERSAVFAPFQVTDAVMSRAAPGAIFMHCLPAHRGEEVAASVIDGPQSVVWDEAENRLHAQKALLEFLLVQR